MNYFVNFTKKDRCIRRAWEEWNPNLNFGEGDFFVIDWLVLFKQANPWRFILNGWIRIGVRDTPVDLAETAKLALQAFCENLCGLRPIFSQTSSFLPQIGVDINVRNHHVYSNIVPSWISLKEPQIMQILYQTSCSIFVLAATNTLCIAVWSCWFFLCIKKITQTVLLCFSGLNESNTHLKLLVRL